MQILSELLIIFLMFLCNIRAFFNKESRHDSLVVLAPLSFVLAILQVFVFGLSWINIYLVLLGLLVFLSNFHAILRFSERLYVDHYSPLMIFWAVLTTLLCIPAFLFSIWTHPVEIRSSDMNLEENQYIYDGDFAYGFREVSDFRPGKLFLNEFKRDGDDTTEYPVLIFVSDKRGDTVNYKPYLQGLAKEGFIVYSGDFYSKDVRYLHNIFDNKVCRRFFMVLDSFLRSHQFMAQREFYTYNTRKEYEMMMKILDERLGKDVRYFLVSDYMGTVAAQDLLKTGNSKISGYFAMESIENYKTTGYGIISRTDPFLAFLLGSKDEDAEALVDELVMATEAAYFGE